MRKIFFLLLIIMPVITACNSEDKLPQNAESNISSENNKLIEDCLAAAEDKYLEDMQEMCETNQKTIAQKIKTCEEMHFPWRQQDISRDQYCRNTTVETLEPKENYRKCMEGLNSNIAESINRCTGAYVENKDNYCNLPDLFLQKLEEDKQNNIKNCNKI